MKFGNINLFVRSNSRVFERGGVNCYRDSRRAIIGECNWPVAGHMCL